MTNHPSAIGKQTKQSQAPVHIYWDLQNVHLTRKQAELLVDLTKSKGRLDCFKIYYNSQNKNQLLAKNNVEYLGGQGVDVRSKDKNSVDKALTFDWIKGVVIKPYPEIIILVSGDRDFAPLISLMLAIGKTIIVFGRRKSASKKVINLVGEDNFHDVDELSSLCAGLKRQLKNHKQLSIEADNLSA